jgi:hypothetical protein
LIAGDKKGGREMGFAIFGAAMGALCAVCYRQIFILLLLSTLLVMGCLMAEVIRHNDPWLIATKALIAVSAMQMTYVVVALSLQFRSTSSMLPSVQTAIGRQLRVEFEVPYILPGELSVLVSRLNSIDRGMPRNCITL